RVSGRHETGYLPQIASRRIEESTQARQWGCVRGQRFKQADSERKETRAGGERMSHGVGERAAAERLPKAEKLAVGFVRGSAQAYRGPRLWDGDVWTGLCIDRGREMQVQEQEQEQEQESASMRKDEMKERCGCGGGRGVYELAGGVHDFSRGRHPEKLRLGWALSRGCRSTHRPRLSGLAAALWRSGMMRPRCLDDRRLPSSVATPRPRYGLSILHRVQRDSKSSSAEPSLHPADVAPLRPRGPPSSPPHNTLHTPLQMHPSQNAVNHPDKKKQPLRFPPFRLAHASGSPMPVVRFSFTTCASHRTASEGLVPLNPTPKPHHSEGDGSFGKRPMAGANAGAGGRLAPTTQGCVVSAEAWERAKREETWGTSLISRIRFNPSKQAHAR
ncbi:uncharacterized protein BKA78DRAFT_358627, partial [Phyllosticta capitalensis]|uniref:uncharacterized protein n=1 Tax=Phyllosticta capitalensis TaxID=121624 RepID=UPI003131A68B